MTRFGSEGSKLGLELVKVGSKVALQNHRTVVDSQDMGSLVSRLDRKQSTNVNSMVTLFWSRRCDHKRTVFGVKGSRT